MAYTHLIAYLLVRPPIYSDQPIESISEFFNEIRQTSGKINFVTSSSFPVIQNELNNTVFDVEVFEYLGDVSKNAIEDWLGFKFDNILNSPNQKFPRTCGILRISAQLILPNVAGQRNKGNDKLEIVEVNEKVSKKVYGFRLASEFRERIYDLIIAFNLSNPSALEIDGGIITQDGKYLFAIDQMCTIPLQFAVRTATRIGWPYLHQLEFTKVWKWLIKQKGFLNGFSNGTLERSLNAFTHLFKVTDDELSPVHLFWALVGIEALYVKEKNSLLEQVREKSQLFLGKQKEFKKKISRMYNFRSRFIHGDLDFPNSYVSTRDAVASKYEDELIEATALAIAILVASIQELISRDWKGVEFSLEISGSTD